MKKLCPVCNRWFDAKFEGEPYCRECTARLNKERPDAAPAVWDHKQQWVPVNNGYRRKIHGGIS